ncbi:MAG TPA: nuclear transport factor 2 family protein [Ktedonosporobacter sp.]|nr:nuclear transport factor 2 family protein [Ktedonosporobacter sp.]
MEMTPGRAFYQRQIEALETYDLKTIRAQYDENATLVNYNEVIKGREAIANYFKSYLASLGFLKLKSTDRFMETDDSIFFEATVETQLGVAQVYDVFMLRDGKATYHFAGIISPRSA